MATDDCDLTIEVSDQGTLTKLVNAWVYWREGGVTTTLRANADGAVMAFGGSGDATKPVSYSSPFRTHVDATVDAFYSTGAQPIPNNQFVPALKSCKVTLAVALTTLQRIVRIAPGGLLNSIRQLPLGKVQVPAVVIGITRPAELSLWLALHEPLDERAPPPRGAVAPPDRYYVDGIPQGQAWFAQANAGSLENTAPAAPSAAVRPRERGLRVEGFIATGATGVTVRIARQNALLDLKQDGSNPNSTTVNEIAATMIAATGTQKGFSATIFFADATQAFGPIQILVASSGGLTPPIVGAFTYHLAGAQIALVDDHLANSNGTAAGPILGEANEVTVLDYLISPAQISPAATPPAKAAARAAARATLASDSRTRRMVRYDIRADRRSPLALPMLATRNNPAPPGGVAGVHSALPATTVSAVLPEMPMWMAELQLVGLSREQLEDLMVRRVTQLGAAPSELSFQLQWDLRLEWHGPDKDMHPRPRVAGPVQMPAFVATSQQTFKISLDKQPDPLRRRIDGADANGKVGSALSPAPTAVAFPVQGRRVPTLTFFQNGSGPTRSWDRHGAAAQPTTVMEFQPIITSDGTATGSPIIRGGDGLLQLTNLQVDGQTVDGGIVFARPTSPPATTPPRAGPVPAGTAVARVHRFRVRGLNASDQDLDTLVNAVVELIFRQNAASSRWLDFLPLSVWQATTRLVVGHETDRRQFAVPRNARDIAVGRIAFETEAHGKERDMPMYGPPRGYGIGQLDPPGNQERVWSLFENIHEGARRLMIDGGQRAMATLGREFANAAVGLPRRSKAVFHRQVVRAYNGGTEFHFDAASNDWVIQPSIMTEPNIYYPDSVLMGLPSPMVSTTVPYENMLQNPHDRQRHTPAPVANVPFTTANFPAGL